MEGGARGPYLPLVASPFTKSWRSWLCDGALPRPLGGL
jgi:hypothetical protein